MSPTSSLDTRGRGAGRASIRFPIRSDESIAMSENGQTECSRGRRLSYNREGNPMRLDPDSCRQAMLSKDSRFDGRFFVGVVTTGIYCRPVCPAPTPKIENVRFFATASAAADAGLRPCLRCRPESAPGSVPWIGTAATVSRAMRLIQSGELEAMKTEEIAGRLGLSARQLNRLFQRHLGAPPGAVVRTHRLHFAKKLLDETDLKMADIAFSAGYGSIRRFNAVFRSTYGRKPTEVRRLARDRGQVPESEAIDLALPFRQPYDVPAMLGFLASRAIPGVEMAADGAYQRTISFEGIAGWLRVSAAEDNRVLRVQVHFPNSKPLLAIVENVRRLLDLDADPARIQPALEVDGRLAVAIDRHPGLRVPGAWDGFELAVRAVLGQQVSVRAASTLAGRLAAEWGEEMNDPACPGLTRIFPRAEDLAEADVARIGLPRKRAETIRHLARAVAEGNLDLRPSVALQEVRGQLLALPGIGPWTTEYISMRALGDPDAFPAGDLGLLKAYGAGRTISARELEDISQVWRPWRAYAAILLWHLD